MAMHYDFKIMLAAKLTRLLNRVIQPSEMSIGTPSEATAIASRNTVIDVTVGDDTYRIAYDRYSFESAFSKMPFTKVLIVRETSSEEILSSLNVTYGLSFTLADFASIEYSEGVCFFTFSPDHPGYIGSFSSRVRNDFNGVVPYHNYWKLNWNTADSGEMDLPLGGTWTFPILNNTRWGKLEDGATPLNFPAGTELPLTGDFVYDFEIMFTTIPMYMCLFGVDPTGDGNVRTNGSLYFFYGRMYIYGIGPGYFGPTMAANRSYRVTFCGRGGDMIVYVDGVQVISFAQLPVVWRSIRNSHKGISQVGPNCVIRDIKIFRTAPTPAELSAIIAGTTTPPAYPVPLHDVASEANNWENRGTSVTPLSNTIPSVMYDGKPFYGNMTASNIKSLGFTLGFTGDFTVDFEAAASTLGDVYGTLFKYTNTTAFTTGDFATTRTGLAGAGDRPYLYGITNTPNPAAPMNGGIVVRHTITRKAGVIRWYENGVLLNTVPTSSTQSFNWRFFDGRRSLALFRNLRFWNRAITDAEIDALLANK